ncbi:MAG: MoaD/ThiS family protein [Bacillota bacterium]
MKIYFEVRGGLTAQVPPGTADLEDGIDWTVAKLVEKLGLPRHEVGNVVINGKMAGNKTQINDGDKITFFPVIAGG